MFRKSTIITLLLIGLIAQLLSACVADSAVSSKDSQKQEVGSNQNNEVINNQEINEEDNQENNKETKEESNENSVYYSFVDALENTVVLEDKPGRVVSLVGSYAETWLLAGGDLIGVTNDVISERNLDLSEDIEIVGTIKDPNLETILDLSPDFVLLSPDIESHVKAAATLKKANIPHGFFKVEHFEDYLEMLDICTHITDNKDLYEKYGLKVKEQIEEILLKVENQEGSDILFIRAMSRGAKAKYDDNMACKILEDLGTRNIAARHESLLEDLSMEIIIEEDPEYIFVVTMGDSEKAINALKEGIEKDPAWSNLTAVKKGNYIVLPKDLFHYKPNARWGESYEYLAKILYPEIFQ